jgi:predicted GH43/DUF377 family glycosyl hydrolase
MKRSKSFVLFVSFLILVLVMAPGSMVFASDSYYNADPQSLFANECYEKEDTVNNQIGYSFKMHFMDFYDAGSEKWAYYIVNKADGDLAIGRARTTNGTSFTNDGIVLDTAGSGWDDRLASFPGIWKDGSTYYLVYEGADHSGAWTGSVGLATSTNGTSFTKQGRILDGNQASNWESVNIGTPDLYKVGGTWYLTYHGYNGTDCQVGLATGSSLTGLSKYGSNPIIATTGSGPDSGTIGRRDVVYFNGNYYMVYEISTDQPYGSAKWSHAYARSSDMTNWSKLSQNNLIPQTNNKFGNDGPCFLNLSGTWWIYYRWSDATNNFTRRSRLANETNGGYDRIWEAENLYHQIGRSDGDGWSANTSQDNSAFLVYGPYVTDIPVGQNTAVFKAMIDNNNYDNSVVLTLEVYDATADSILASRQITRTQFASTYHYEFFSVPYLMTASGHTMEFRIYWHDASYIKVDRVFDNYGNSY